MNNHTKINKNTIVTVQVRFRAKVMNYSDFIFDIVDKGL